MWEKIRPTSHAAIAHPAREKSHAEPDTDLIDVDGGRHVRDSL
jgi:hypothetical protein